MTAYCRKMTLKQQNRNYFIDEEGIYTVLYKDKRNGNKWTVPKDLIKQIKNDTE